MTNDQPGSFDGLPDVLREIAEVAGIDAAREIARHHGGTEIRIPAQAQPGHWLVECVGRKAADAICAHYRILSADGHASGIRLQIPLAGTGVMAQAKRRLAHELRSGELSVRAAARKCGLHERTAWRLKARLDGGADDGQLDLFDDRR